ncbi:hypothetical protein EDD85DRAFT_794624 [Armillaria nabsnona]|nr:hypothetical protein EDD85DRAFT_794624 [Armillaria nabsnona]
MAACALSALLHPVQWQAFCLNLYRKCTCSQSMSSATKRTQIPCAMKRKFELKVTSIHTNDVACGSWEDFLMHTKVHPWDISTESQKSILVGICVNHFVRINSLIDRRQYRPVDWREGWSMDLRLSGRTNQGFCSADG